jgi:hypothetical protein
MGLFSILYVPALPGKGLPEMIAWAAPRQERPTSSTTGGRVLCHDYGVRACEAPHELPALRPRDMRGYMARHGIPTG